MQKASVPTSLGLWRCGDGCFFGGILLPKKQLCYVFTSEKLLYCHIFFRFGRGNYLTLAASLAGVAPLIFDAEGNPFKQLPMVVFSLPYGGNRAQAEMVLMQKKDICGCCFSPRRYRCPLLYPKSVAHLKPLAPYR